MMSNRSQQVSLSDVSQFLSNFSVELSNGDCIEAPSQILPAINCILSEIQSIVMHVCKTDVIQQQQLQQQQQQQHQLQEEDFWWDSSIEYVEYSDVSCDDQSLRYEDSVSVCGSNSFDAHSCSSMESSGISSDSNTIPTFIDSDAEMRLLEDEIFIDTILDLCDTIAPNSVFSGKRSRRRRQRRSRRKIHHELRSIWSNSAGILFPTERAIVKPRYPSIDWSKVNKKFVDNVPRPTLQPVHGCSQVPDVEKNPDYFTCKFPYGFKSGYKTNMGVIAAPDHLVVHGYIWTYPDGWLLHAEYPQEKPERGGRGRTPFSRPRGKSKREPRQPATPCQASAQHIVSACS